MLVPINVQTTYELAIRAFAMTMRPIRGRFAEACELLKLAGERRDGGRQALALVRSWWHLIAISQGWTDNPDVEISAAAAAIEEANFDDPAARAMRTWVLALVYQDLSSAAEVLGQIIDEAPFCSVAWSLKARVLAGQGDAKGAMFHAGQAEMMPILGPERAWRAQNMALCCYVAGHYAHAVRWARTAAAHCSGLTQTARILAASLVTLGRLNEAAKAAQQVLSIDPEFRHRGMAADSHVAGRCDRNI
ncbi:MAG TPA: tetratricopeptide repeat protein [Rhodopila sp.]|nr:tetratricopeptide repeat protein [Rhodopila sp.]